MEENGTLSKAIREYLNGKQAEKEWTLEITEIPTSLFELAETDEMLINLNRQIRDFPVRNQKLLFFFCSGHDPDLIIESLNLESPDLFWTELADMARILNMATTGSESHQISSDLLAGIKKVFDVNGFLLNEISRISDKLDEQSDKVKKKRKKCWSLASIPLMLLPVFVFLYPLFLKPDLKALYENNKTSFNPDLTLVDTLDPIGSRYHEAVLLFQEKDFMVSFNLFNEIYESGLGYSAESQWFMVLISLYQGDAYGSRELLKVLRQTDPVFFRAFGQRVYRKLR